MVALEVALPVLGAVVAAGFVVSALQSALRQSDPTVSVVPRLLAAGGALLIFGGWMMAVLSGFVVRLWSSVPEMMR